MSEFNDDLHVETDNDSELVRTLRAALRADKAKIKTLENEVQTARTQSVESAVKDALKGVPEAARAKVEKLIRKDAKSAEDVQSWLEEYGDVFGVGVDVPGAEGADATSGGEGGASADGLTAEDIAALRQVREAEAGGESSAPIGPDAIRKVLAEARDMSPENGLEHLRKHGLSD